MAKKNQSNDRNGTQISAQAMTSTTDGKTSRAMKLTRCFFSVIGRSPDNPKRVRGRLGGETPRNDERYWQRRQGVQARAAARERSAHHFAVSQIAMVFDGSEAYA